MGSAGSARAVPHLARERGEEAVSRQLSALDRQRSCQGSAVSSERPRDMNVAAPGGAEGALLGAAVGFRGGARAGSAALGAAAGEVARQVVVAGGAAPGG